MRTPTNSKWVSAPAPSNPRFTGFQTNVDATQLPFSASPAGQNTFINDGDRIANRLYGLTLFPSGTPSTTASGSKSLYTFRLRTGENIFLRAYGTVLEWFSQSTLTWVNLLTGLGSNDFGFAEFNINANAESRLYFGNAVDASMYWNGGHTLLYGALSGGEATITVDSTASFSGTGTLRIGTTDVTYTGITATTFTGCAGTPATADDTPIAQAPVLASGMPVSNIIMTAQNRLFCVPEVNPQLIQFSAYGDSTAWSTNTVLDSTATSSGAFNLIEGGGRVNAMIQDEQSLYFLKDSCIYVATLSDSFYSLEMLKPFDGRSRGTGAIGKRGVFVGGNFVFIVTPDNQIFALQRVQDVNYPQLKSLSHPIQPTVDGFDFSEVVGITYRDYAFFACKDSSEAQTNNVVLAFNIQEGHWESPITGWQVGEWAVYNDGTGESLYFGDAISPNTWKLQKDVISDGPYIITSAYSSKQFDFGNSEEQKDLVSMYVEGYITPSTDLTIRILFDENGYSGSYETTFSGDESQYIIQSDNVNTFGLIPFGIGTFGSSEDLTGKRKFRFYLEEKIRDIPFYVLQVQFISSGENQQWEVLRYGFQTIPHSQPQRRKLIRSI